MGAGLSARAAKWEWVADAHEHEEELRRWRQENAAGEAERISALSGIGAGMITYESMAMAAGEDDADKFKSGGLSPARHRCKTAVRIA